MSVGASGEEVEVFGGWIDVGVLGGGWTRESGGGQVRGGWTDELLYLVSVGGGVECVCVKGSVFHLSMHFFAVSLNLLSTAVQEGCIASCVRCSLFLATCESCT